MSTQPDTPPAPRSPKEAPSPHRLFFTFLSSPLKHFPPPPHYRGKREHRSQGGIRLGSNRFVHPLSIQIIESKKLPVEENLWLKGLTKDLNAKAARSILEEGWKKGKEADIAAYLHTLINANQKAIEEVLAMAKRGLPFDRLIEEMGLAAKLRAEGRADGEARGEKTGWEKALKFLEEGHTVEELKKMTPPVPGK
jgi:hypothetical protein